MNIIKKCKHGLMIFNRKDVWQGKSFETYGEYSESETKLFQAIIKKDDTVIDAGANIGSFTASFSHLVGPNGYVIAFEPERHAFYTLCGNVAVNNFKNVICIHQALSDEVKIINVPELDYEKTTNFGGLELDKDYSNSTHYPVFCTTIDNLNLTKCNFIKIDVEGMELNVLKGAEKTIKEHKPILYVEADREDKKAPLIEYIKSLNYNVLLHKPPFWNPDNFYDNKINVFGDVISLNLFCWIGDCSLIPADYGLLELPSQ